MSAEAPATNMVLAAYDEWKAAKDRDMLSRHCEACKGISELGGALICDRCNRTWHLSCLSLLDVPSGFWYCLDCSKHIAKNNERDLTYDSE